MTEERARRKLAAILSADVQGYSRLMGDDEVATVRTLTSYREVMGALIRQYRGRVVDSPGDNLLAEFGSVVDAVECAVKIQETIKNRNTPLPETRRMSFRIGINLGDVIQEEERIYGDGVNIAARIEGLAESGGICISGSAYEQVENKLSVAFENIGEHEVKNIAKPVRVYRVLTSVGHAHDRPKGKADVTRSRTRTILPAVFLLVLGAAFAIWSFFLRPSPPGVEVASPDKMAFPLPEKPSIAVLPFDNMSGNPEQDYLADGLSENIINALSHIPEMFVIARNSTFVFKGKPVKVQQVSEELGVRYVVEGSVQTEGERMRVAARLIDATTGNHLWGSSYDRHLKDLFALQDEITLRILTALQMKLTEGEQARLWSATDNLEAWRHLTKGSNLFERYTGQGNARAREHFERAVILDPEWDLAWTMLAWTHWADARFRWRESPDESMARAVEIAERAAAINDTLPELHSLLSNIHLLKGNYELAVMEGKKAVALGPNSALCHVLLAYAMNCVGKFDEAIVLAERAIRLSPYSSPWFLLVLDNAYRMTGRYMEAVVLGERYLARCKKEGCNPFPGHMGLASSYIGLDRTEDARDQVAELLKIDPGFSLTEAPKMFFFRDDAYTEHCIDMLRRAGLPEQAPASLSGESSS